MGRFSRNGTERDFGYIAPYIEFPAGKPRGYSKGIFKFRIEPYAAIFKAGQGH